MTDILERQRRPLAEIVEVRRGISAELRKFLTGGATTFAKVAATLTPEQRAVVQRLRGGDVRSAAPVYLYSDPLPQAPAVEKTAFFFPPPVGK